MQYKIPVAVLTSAVVVAMLVATPGIIVSYQQTFAVPPGVSGPGNAQGQCYAAGNSMAHAQGIQGETAKDMFRDPCPPPVGLVNGHP